MFTKANDWGYINEHTIKRVRALKLLQVDNQRLRFLSKEECSALIDACDGHLRPIVITAIHTGMRKGEILNLKRDRVDFQNGFIFVGNTKNGVSRQLSISNTLRTTLRSIFQRLDINSIFFNKSTDKAYKDVSQSLKTACKLAKIHDCTFHTLRHTFASHLVMTGVDLKTVKELMGHKDIRMTLRYAHLAPHHTQKAVQEMDKIFGSGQKLGKKRIADNEYVV